MPSNEGNKSDQSTPHPPPPPPFFYQTPTHYIRINKTSQLRYRLLQEWLLQNQAGHLMLFTQQIIISER